MKCNTIILTCFIQFIQFTWTPRSQRDSSQREGSKFLNLLQKEGIPRPLPKEKGGIPSEKEGGQPWMKL